MLQRAIQRATGRGALASTVAMRGIATTRVLRSGQTTMSALLSALPDANVQTADHLMTAERAVQLMAEMHLSALPVVKNDKIVGLFTEHDYTDKVLSGSHQAVRTTKLFEVASMGSALIVAYPEDTVEGCLEVMTKKKLSAMPVVEHDGHVVGTVSMKELTNEMHATDAPSNKQHNQQKQHDQPKQQSAAASSTYLFSTPSHFPENILAAGDGFHDDITAGMASPEQLQQIYDQLKRDMDHALEQQGTKISFDSAAAEHFHLDPHLDEIAVKSFSESSAFPEFTPTEDGLFVQTHGVPPTAEELLKLRAKK